MKPVEIYTSPLCGYCHAAKRLLNDKGVTYSEFNVMLNAEKRKEMMQRANGRPSVLRPVSEGLSRVLVAGFADISSACRR